MIISPSYSILEEASSEPRSSVWLPIISTPSYEQVAFSALASANGQQHPVLLWDKCLAQAAAIRADQVSVEWGHKFQGKWVNGIVRTVCPLPQEYSDDVNSVESLIAGIRDPVKALNILLGSKSHADHLLGRNNFFREQSRVGISFLERVGSEYTFYYVFLISK